MTYPRKPRDMWWDAVFKAGREAHPGLQLFGVSLPGDGESRLTGTMYDGTNRDEAAWLLRAAEWMEAETRKGRPK